MPVVAAGRGPVHFGALVVLNIGTFGSWESRCAGELRRRRSRFMSGSIDKIEESRCPIFAAEGVELARLCNHNF